MEFTYGGRLPRIPSAEDVCTSRHSWKGKEELEDSYPEVFKGRRKSLKMAVAPEAGEQLKADRW